MAFLTTGIAVLATPPSFKMDNNGFSLEHVGRIAPSSTTMIGGPTCRCGLPLAKASRKECSLRGNIVSRDMWEWQSGYTFKLEEGLKDCRDLIANARASGLKNIPDPIIGCDKALVRPESGKIEDTLFQKNAGSDLVVAEALKS